MLTTLLYSLLALDQTVSNLAAQYGAWVFALLFLVIFAETGLVIFPFLPGDSILFIAGTVVAVASLNVHVLVIVLIIAAVLGDSVNYAVGHYLGPKAFERRDSRWFRQEYLRRTQAFYDKYGGVTIIIGRFVPIIRTFAPFLAGVAGMSYRRFLSYNVIGGCLWISSLVYAGYLFGNIRWVKDNLSLIVVAIVVVSLIPAITTFVRERRGARDGAAASRSAGRGASLED
ncbi:MAG TPA: DedA family protein [Casimicrobiaceae bacterium]